MARYDIVIFDVGATLVGFLRARPFRRLLQDMQPARVVTAAEGRALHRAWLAAYARYSELANRGEGPDNPADYWRAVMGDACAAAGVADQQATVAALERRFWTGELRGPYRDVRPTLQALRARSVAMGIISNYTPHLEAHLRRWRLRTFFRFVIASTVVGVSKPDPAIFRMALAMAHTDAERALYVGDEPRDDMEGARSVGLPGVLIDREARYPDAPYQRMRDLSELVSIV